MTDRSEKPGTPGVRRTRQEPYPGWLEAFEHQRGLSRRRHEDQGDDPIPDETWERWKQEILADLTPGAPTGATASEAKLDEVTRRPYIVPT